MRFLWCVNSPKYEKKHLIVKKPEMNRLATHLFTNPHNHYPARAITVMVSSLMTGLALPMNQKSLQKDIESLGGFIWKFKNQFHHDILPLKI